MVMKTGSIQLNGNQPDCWVSIYPKYIDLWKLADCVDPDLVQKDPFQSV